MMNPTKPLIAVVGPTAVGKTALSIRLAQRFNGEIISADSRLFYKGMDIGTAKPSLAEMNLVPHHMIDVAEPDDVWSLALYLPKVTNLIGMIHDQGKIPFLVGGTGQYIKAVVEGWDLPEIKPDPSIRQALTDWAGDIGVDGLRSRLELIDPEAAADIDGPNLRRMIRAFEVIFTSGHKFSAQKTKSGSQYRVLQIGLSRPREELYKRIDLRIDQMIENGLIDEVQTLLDLGYDPDSSSLSAIGYKQIADYLYGLIPLEEAIRQIRSKTRKYVRQQANWFQKDDPAIRWFEITIDTDEQIIEEIQHFLS
jgi:tRNA dimethylallyltransferase